MARLRSRQFAFGALEQFVLRKPLRYAGKTYARGDSFYPARVAITDRKIRMLWDAGFLAHPDEMQQRAAEDAGQMSGKNKGEPLVPMAMDKKVEPEKADPPKKPAGKKVGKKKSTKKQNQGTLFEE